MWVGSMMRDVVDGVPTACTHVSYHAAEAHQHTSTRCAADAGLHRLRPSWNFKGMSLLMNIKRSHHRHGRAWYPPLACLGQGPCNPSVL
jgi:hypothetical protein